MGCMRSPSAPQFVFEGGCWCFSFPKPWFFLSFPVVVPPNVYSTTLKKKKKAQDQAKKDRKRKRKVNLNFLPCFMWELSVMIIRSAWLCVRACVKHLLAHWYVSWASSPQFSTVVASVTLLCGVEIWELAVSYPLSLSPFSVSSLIISPPCSLDICFTWEGLMKIQSLCAHENRRHLLNYP